MKRYNTETRVIVDFDPAEGVKPLYFIASSGKREKIDAIMEKDEARWGFRSYTRYKCGYKDRIIELYWDRQNDKWILIKEGIR